MKCLYCDGDYMHNSSLIHYLISGDMLCEKCRRSLDFKPVRIDIRGMKVLCLYVYDDSFRSLIIQYKECNDEALKDVFIYDVKDYLRVRYHGYKVVWVPSSMSHLKRRGFDHMKGIMESVGLEMTDIIEKIEDISQNNLNGSKREKMIDNFRLKKGSKIPDKVLLVDDVLTTGSSLYGVYRLLCQDVTKIDILSLSYVKR